MPLKRGFRCARVKMVRLASQIALCAASGNGTSFLFVASASAGEGTSSTAIVLAISPAAAPPMPSQTRYTPASMEKP